MVNLNQIQGKKQNKMMRKLSLISFTILLGLSCNSQTPQDTKPESNATKKVVIPEKLTKQLFLEKIMDYEKNPDKWIYKGSLPGLIDFYADWCRPCRITSPIIEDLAQEYAGRIVVYKVDIQAEQELAAVFDIQSIPAFLFIPVNDTPVMSAGIAQTPEATKQLFKQQIEEILLKK
jgi:thioredoxin